MRRAFRAASTFIFFSVFSVFSVTKLSAYQYAQNPGFCGGVIRDPLPLDVLGNLATENTENTEEYRDCAGGSQALASLDAQGLLRCQYNQVLLRVLCVLRD